MPGGRTVSYTYKSDGNLASLTPPGRPTHTFTYDLAGKVTGYTPPSLGAGNWQLQYAYDADRRLTHMNAPDGQQVQISYDPVSGRQTSLTMPGTVIGYQYDPANGALIGLTRQGGANLAFAYDGGLLTQITTQGPFNGAVLFASDNLMRLKTWTVGGTAITYQYDRDNLLTQAGVLNLTRHPLTGS